MERILITGAAGFLGSHLADRFLLEGYHVIGVDNLITGSPENIANLQKNEGFSFLRHDISTPLYIHEELDGVLHFASRASPVDYLELPIQTLKVGSLGTHNMLGLSLAKSARFLLASTSGGVRRSGRPPAARGVLGQRESGGSTRRLRRGQALR